VCVWRCAEGAEGRQQCVFGGVQRVLRADSSLWGGHLMASC